MLNLTRLHLGIAHESQFQGLGINGLGVAGWTCCSHSLFDPTLDTGRHQPAIGLDFAFSAHRRNDQPHAQRLTTETMSWVRVDHARRT